MFSAHSFFDINTFSSTWIEGFPCVPKINTTFCSNIAFLQSDTIYMVFFLYNDMLFFSFRNSCSEMENDVFACQNFGKLIIFSI